MKIFAIFWEDDNKRNGVAIVAALSVEKASELYRNYWNKASEDVEAGITIIKVTEFNPEKGPAIFYQFEAFKE